jgi:hypothetical protein
MDVITQRLIALGKKIREEVSSIRIVLDRLKNQVDSISKDHQAQDQQDDAPIKVLAEMHSAETIQVKTQSDDAGQPRRDRIRLWIEGLALAGAVIIGFLAYQQWREMIITADATAEAAYAARRSAATASAAFADSKKSFNDTLTQMQGQTTAQGVTARAAKNQVAATIDAMRLSQRPWVGVDDDPPGLSVSPIEFDEQGNASGLAFLRPKNFSNYAAQEVMSHVELIISDSGGDVLNPDKAICMEPSAGFGNVLFPGRTGQQQSQTTFDIPLYYPRDKMTHPNVAKKTTTAWIIGCISYADQFDLPYHTKLSLGSMAPEVVPLRSIPRQTQQLMDGGPPLRVR